MWSAYYTPKSLDEALDVLSDHQERARVVAGATDLILEIERGQRPDISVLIDITRIAGLDSILVDDEGWVHLGPLVTHNHCAGSELLRNRANALVLACWSVGAPQIRNRGTIAGNLITASPANDTITPLMALGAKVTLRSVRGERDVFLEDFYKGVRKTVLGSDEILTDIAFPLPSESTRSTFIKLGLRQAQAISVVNVAAVVERFNGQVGKASITLGSVAPTIIHAQKAEAYLNGKALSAETILQAAGLAAATAKPISDVRATAAYRKDMVEVCTSRALAMLKEGTEHEGIPEHPVMLWGERQGHVETELKQGYIHTEGTPIETTINGRTYELFGFNKSLLRLIREDAGLTGSKEGCAEGECGACTVFLDGAAVMSCMVPAPRAHHADIVTVEGLAQNGRLHPIQQAFVEEGAVQCGYCTPGFLMSGAKLLEEVPYPDHDQITQSITGNLCRCTGYYKILKAFERAVELVESDQEKA